MGCQFHHSDHCRASVLLRVQLALPVAVDTEYMPMYTTTVVELAELNFEDCSIKNLKLT